MSMRAGSMRHRIEIQEATETANSFGEVTRAWATIAKRWASIEPLSGRELLEAQKIEERVSHKVRLRYYSAMNPKMRIKHGTRLLNIGSIINVNERGAEHELMCTEVV